MTIRTALRGTMRLATACLLAAGVASAQGSTSPATAPTISDYGLHQPSPEQGTAPSTTTPTDSPASSAMGEVGNDNAPTSVAGRIQKIDRADDTIEIDGVDRQLKLDSNTRITRNGSQASFSDVREGEQVRASFDDGFPAHVRQVDIMSPTRAGATPDSSGAR